MGQLEDIEIFVRVVEAGSISRAAEQLGLAKSAVSRRLGSLETRLGTRLLNRTTRKSSLTDAGNAYYTRAVKLIDDVTELNTVASSTNLSLTGTLRLAVPLTFGLSHLAPVIDTFAKDNPQLTIQIDFSDRHINLVEEGVDLAFRITDLKDSSLKARKITPIRFALCASPAYLQQYGTPHSAADLKTHKLLHYVNPGATAWRLVDSNGKEHTVSQRANIITNNGDFLRDMSIAGHGICLCPTFILWKAIATGELVTLLTNYTLPVRYAYVVYPQTRYLSQRARKLIDFIVERFGNNPYWDQAIYPHCVRS